MNTFNVRHKPAMYRVGGRLYRLTNLSPTCVRLQDLLDGECLTFSQAEALQMIVQQDLIVLRLSPAKDGYQTDPDDLPYSPGRTQGRAPEQQTEATDPRRQRARQRTERRRDAPPPAPRSNGAVNPDPCHCTQKLERMQACLTRRDYPTTAPVQLIILDEVQYYMKTSAAQTHYRTLHRILEQASRLCNDAGAIGCCKAARRSLLVGRPQRTESEASLAVRAWQPRGAALERAGGRWATAAHELNSAPDAGVDDVE